MATSLEGLKKRIRGDVITPDHPQYVKSTHRWAINAEKTPAIVVFVKDEADVAAAIFYAREQNMALAICGGGHSASGASSITDGLVIDLSRYIDYVRVEPESRLAYIGGGALWATVDRTAIQYGLATTCGTVEHTGVGGLALGGGFGWLCPEHGLVIDNIQQVTVVSADGVTRKASKEENPDLFFGVRGGGCNFGVVTEFVLRLHPQRRTVFTGSYIFAADKLQQVVEACQRWLPTAGPKEGTMMMPTCMSDGTPVVVCYVFFNGSKEEGRARFEFLSDIGPFYDNTEEVPFEKLNTILNPIAEHRYGVYCTGVTVRGPDYETTAKVHQRLAEICKDGRFTAVAIYEWWSLEKIIWPGEMNSREMVKEARRYGREVAKLVAGLTDMSDPENRAYNNYDNEGVRGAKEEVKDKAKISFGMHYPALQRIKKKYDPENIFNRWFAITPAP